MNFRLALDRRQRRYRSSLVSSTSVLDKRLFRFLQFRTFDLACLDMEKTESERLLRSDTRMALSYAEAKLPLSISRFTSFLGFIKRS